MSAHLVDHADVRQQIADDLTAFADTRRAAAYRYAAELSICARLSNDCVVNAYYTAAAIARDGNPANPACGNCKDTRGGPQSHGTAVCSWRPCNSADEADALAHAIVDHFKLDEETNR